MFLTHILTVKLLIKDRKTFLEMVRIVIRNDGNNGDIHRSLKYCIQNFKASLKNIKIKISIFYILKKTKLKAERKVDSPG